MAAAVRVRVTGRVQGVCYRASTRDQASALGLSGWVRNLSDGSVEAWLEGDQARIDEMLAWMRQGPEHAQVLSLEQTPCPAAGHQCFEVRR